MTAVTYVLVGTAGAAAAAHALLPDHWLPYVLTAKARQMSCGRAAVMAGAGSIAHLFSTVIIGVLFALAGDRVATQTTWALDRLVGLVVVCLGAYFIWRGWPGKYRWHGHDHHDQHGHPQHGHDQHGHGCHKQDHRGRGSDYALGAILGARPCAEAVPIFLAVSTQGVFSSMAAIGSWVVVTVASMVGIVWLSAAGVEALRLGWLERYGEVISGAIIAVIGLITFL